VLSRALKEARKSDHFHHRHATLLFKGSVLHAAGYNQGWKHSEIMALNSVKHKGTARGMIAFNVRVTRGGRIGMSKPCEECKAALIKAGVKAVWFTDDEGLMFKEIYG
jgi:tRNA(Arg) A34 adenosine deaminase TadA